jgi:hypothetical protein
MLDVATQVGTWSQYSRNMVATWGRGEKDFCCWMLHITAFATFSEHVRNTLATFTRWTLDLTADD